MTPTLEQGDLILLDLMQYEVRDDAVYVLRHHDTLRVKRVQRRMDGVLLVTRDNPAYTGREEIRPSAAEDVQVLGKVVWIGRQA